MAPETNANDCKSFATLADSNQSHGNHLKPLQIVSKDDPTTCNNLETLAQSNHNAKWLKGTFENSNQYKRNCWKPLSTNSSQRLRKTTGRTNLPDTTTSNGKASSLTRPRSFASCSYACTTRTRKETDTDFPVGSAEPLSPQPAIYCSCAFSNHGGTLPTNKLP